MEEIKKLTRVRGAEIRKAKEILAFETTKILHGEEAAEKARSASRLLFGKEKGKAHLIPTIFINKNALKKGILISKLFNTVGLAKSVSEARRLIIQGGGYLNEKRLDNPNLLITEDNFKNGEILLRAGKKKHQRIKLSN